MDAKDQNAITKIHEIINWLTINVGSQDINELGIELNKLSIWAANFADQVADAHEMMNTLEHSYDVLLLEYTKEHGSERGQGAKAERDGELKYADKKKEFNEYKNLYKRLQLKLASIDRIMDTFKQRVSALKQLELKHL